MSTLHYGIWLNTLQASSMLPHFAYMWTELLPTMTSESQPISMICSSAHLEQVNLRWLWHVHPAYRAYNPALQWNCGTSTTISLLPFCVHIQLLFHSHLWISKETLLPLNSSKKVLLFYQVTNSGIAKKPDSKQDVCKILIPYLQPSWNIV